jgi:hypothetical protein
MMMNCKLIFAFATIVILAFAMPSIVLAGTDKDYCYDQVGDGHPCFDSKQKCRQEQKGDDIAESPCYNKDRAL